jgi:hypothetical protein
MSDFPKHWTEALFKRFSVMYGSKWSAMWADVPMADVIDAWQEDLNGVNAEQVKRALDYLKANNPFPPTLPQFLSICRQFRVAPQNVAYLPAPVSRMPPEIRQQLREVLTKLRGGNAR